MNTSILFALVCALSSAACDISCFGECDDWDDECSDERHGDGGGKSSGGSSDSASGGKGATGNDSGGSPNSGNSAGTGSSAGKGGVPVSCVEERDCPRGFNCDYERKQCVAADAETCPELSTESVCDNRNDCMSIYAGLNCSCGANCECVGGEPGCVCQSFEFFACEPLKN